MGLIRPAIKELALSIHNNSAQQLTYPVLPVAPFAFCDSTLEDPALAPEEHDAPETHQQVREAQEAARSEVLPQPPASPPHDAGRQSSAAGLPKGPKRSQ